jgi:hypothetical protein
MEELEYTADIKPKTKAKTRRKRKESRSQTPFFTGDEPLLIMPIFRTETSRKNRKVKEPEPKHKHIPKMNAYWDRFLLEGKEIFNFMIQNYDQLVSNEQKLRHFFIRGDGWPSFKELNDPTKPFFYDVQVELIKWIRKEHSEMRLFDANLWKPFRDFYELDEMWFGYKKMFNYEGMYYQFAMQKGCENYDTCLECAIDGNDEDYYHFELVRFEWLDPNTPHYDPFIIISLPDEFMPEHKWLRE